MVSDNLLYKDLLDNLYDGVYFVDRNRKITYWNRAAERLTGYSASEVAGSCCADNILMHINDQGTNLCSDLCPIAKTIADGQMRETEVYLHHKGGQRIPVSVRVTPITDAQGQIIGAVEIFHDNTSELTMRDQIAALRKMAMLDSLTEIGNRRFADINLNARSNEFQRYHWPFGVLFIDIDYFKRINDTYGHDIGDSVLRMVAQTLSNNIRPFDTVCRWGGEEFFAIFSNVTSEQLFTIANKLRVLVQQSKLPVGKQTVTVTVSIGATLMRQGDTTETLLKRVDQLLYQSKTKARNCVSMPTDE
jgi:diguanylate cyclase (GGDEF)-like protein/PAS domain S-box-containing protein